MLIVRSEDFRSDGVGRDFVGIESEPDVSTVQGAAAFGVSYVDWLALVGDRFDPAIVLGQARFEGLPEIFGADGDCSGWRICAGIPIRLDVAIGRREANLEADDDGVGVGVVIGRGLLRAVTGTVGIRSFEDLCVRSEDADIGNVGAFFRRRKFMEIRL